MSKYRNQIEFKVIFIAEGSSCRFDKNDIEGKNIKKIISKRNSFGIEALNSLGVKNYHFYNLPCGRLDQVPIIEINKIIEKEINNFKPDTVFTHSSNDTNNDHLIVHETQMATRPGAKHLLKSCTLMKYYLQLVEIYKNFCQIISNHCLKLMLKING